MSENQTSKKLQELISVLSSSPTDDVILRHIQDIRAMGNEQLIKPIIHILVTTENEMVFHEITQILYELKNQNCIEPLIQMIQDESTLKYRNVLASALWQSNLHCEAHVKPLVDIALKNDYLTCIEILTVIENLSNNISDQDLIDSLRKIDDYLAQHQDEKNTLLMELKLVLEQFLMK